MKLTYIYIFFILLNLYCISSCARKGSPEGGPVDQSAPVLIEASPESETLNFFKKKIRFKFDQYVKLMDVNKQIVISPPLNYEPIYTPLGIPTKKLSIQILDTLKDDTTYLFNFGQSIVGNNEGVILEGLKYVFSTGELIDSLTVKGKIKSAYEREDQNYINVLLYEVNENFRDSIIFNQRPRYVTSTLDTTLFELTNIKEGKYLMIALKDASNNYIYNPTEDRIGFVNEIISVPTDSIYTIPVFKEELPFKLKKPKSETVGRITFPYQGELKDTIQFRLQNNTLDNFQYLALKDREKDTINYWHTPLMNVDSLVFNTIYKDSVLNFSVRTSRKPVDTLVIKAGISRDLHPRDTFFLKSSTPIIEFDSNKISLTNKDTLTIPFKAKLDPLKDRLQILFKFDYQEKYTFTFYPSALTSFYGEANKDTLIYRLNTQTVEDYGNIFLTLEGDNNYPIILELLDDKDNILEKRYIEKPKKEHRFLKLKPAKYSFRVIEDVNQTGNYTTGNFINRKQAENVYYFPIYLDLRANWDLNETFNLIR